MLSSTAGAAEHQGSRPDPLHAILAASFGGLFLLLPVVAVVVFALRRRRKTQRSNEDTFRTDENHVYGTYSRGSLEDGEYGDGDVVEFTDNNETYGQ